MGCYCYHPRPPPRPLSRIQLSLIMLNWNPHFTSRGVENCKNRLLKYILGLPILLYFHLTVKISVERK